MYLKNIQTVRDRGKNHANFGSKSQNYAWRQEACCCKCSIQKCVTAIIKNYQIRLILSARLSDLHNKRVNPNIMTNFFRNRNINQSLKMLCMKTFLKFCTPTYQQLTHCVESSKQEEETQGNLENVEQFCLEIMRLLFITDEVFIMIFGVIFALYEFHSSGFQFVFDIHEDYHFYYFTLTYDLLIKDHKNYTNPAIKSKLTDYKK